MVRHLFRANKAGHTGSLDPLATGMLPICFGEATKLCGQLLDSDKCYAATVALGQKTTTGDAEGEIVARSDPQGLDLAAFESVRPRFLGPIRQVPPMYSALKHQGQRLYELARAGEEVDRAPREVTIRCLGLLSLSDAKLDIRVTCSKGTYIRTLAEDLAAAVGQQAHLSMLRRLEVGPFRGMRMWSYEELERIAGDLENADLAVLDACLEPLSSAVSDWPQVRLPDAQLARLAKGQAVPLSPESDGMLDLPEPSQGRQVAVMNLGGDLKALAQVGADAQLVPKRWLGGTVRLEAEGAAR